MSICYDFQKWTMISLATCDEIDKQMLWNELEEGKNLKDALGVD